MFRGQNSTFVGKTQGNPWHELTRASAKSPSLALVHRLISLSRSFDLGRLSAPRVLHNRGNRHSLITLSDRYCTSRTSVCACVQAVVMSGEMEQWGWIWSSLSIRNGGSYGTVRFLRSPLFDHSPDLSAFACGTWESPLLHRSNMIISRQSGLTGSHKSVSLSVGGR